MSEPEPTPPIEDAVDADRGDDPGFPVFDGLEFPGCVAVPMTTAQYEATEERLEFWDEAAGIAMIADSPPGVGHEQPIGLLAGIVERIAEERGSRIARFRELCLTRHGAGGNRRAMQPDECLYLYPERADLPTAGSLVVGENDPPDVVVEVDYTTDVRRGKLRVYESWAFPELWVEVPDSEPPRRRRSQLSGLTVYLLNRDGRYETAPESRAFPGWRAEEIHLAINEPAITPAINATVRRVGARLGARDGTGRTTTRCWPHTGGRAGQKAAQKVECANAWSSSGRPCGLGVSPSRRSFPPRPAGWPWRGRRRRKSRPRVWPATRSRTSNG